MGASAENQEDQNADRNVDRKGQAYKMPSVNEGCVRKWTRAHACLVLAEDLSPFLHIMRLFMSLTLKVIDSFPPVISALTKLRQRIHVQPGLHSEL